MEEAQDAVFDQNFFQPAIAQAQKHNVTSPLGLAAIYDTQIQGGLFILLPRVTERLGGIIGDVGPNGPIKETAWINAFLDLREQRLLKLAQQYADKGDRNTSEALRISTFRIHEFRKLLQAGNLALEGEMNVRGQKVSGIVFS